MCSIDWMNSRLWTVAKKSPCSSAFSYMTWTQHEPLIDIWCIWGNWEVSDIWARRINEKVLVPEPGLWKNSFFRISDRVENCHELWHLVRSEAPPRCCTLVSRLEWDLPKEKDTPPPPFMCMQVWRRRRKKGRWRGEGGMRGGVEEDWVGLSGEGVKAQTFCPVLHRGHSVWSGIRRFVSLGVTEAWRSAAATDIWEKH